MLRHVLRRAGGLGVLAAAVIVCAAPPAAGAPRSSPATPVPITFIVTQPEGTSAAVSFTGGIASISGAHLETASGTEATNLRTGPTNSGFSITVNWAYQPTITNTVELSGLLSPGTPVTGVATIPANGVSITASVNGGPAQTLANGSFSLPYAASLGAAPGPSVSSSPGRVRAGRAVRVSGNVAGRCVAGSSLALLSRAFDRTYSFAGVPAIYATVRRDGGYAVRTTIPGARTPGRYRITGRCGGGALGAIGTVRVLGR